MTGFGNIGGIIATYSFVAADAPFYTKGYAICVSFICLSVLACVLYAVAITWENKRRSKQLHNLNLTETEKMDLGVSLFLLGWGCVVVLERLLTIFAGHESRV